MTVSPHPTFRLLPVVERALRKWAEPGPIPDAEVLPFAEDRLRQLTEAIGESLLDDGYREGADAVCQPGLRRDLGSECQSLYDSPQSWMDAIHPDDQARGASGRPTGRASGL
jgi:hypothetical protein